MRKSGFVLLIALLLAGLARPAFGASESGPMVGLGLGFGRVSLRQSYGGEITSRAAFAPCLSARCGYAFSKAFEVYLFGNGWLTSDWSWNAIGVGGLGATLRPGGKAQGLFVSAGLGVSIFLPCPDILRPRPGFLLGIGYGFSSRFGVRADLMSSNIGGSQGEFERALGFGVTLEYRVF